MHASAAVDNEAVAKPEPRYVLSFRPGTAEMVVVGVLVVLGAAVAVGVTWIAREITCGESDSDCGGARALLIVAIVGLMPALGMLITSGRRTGHPWRWFVATVLVYAVWGVAFAGFAG